MFVGRARRFVRDQLPGLEREFKICRHLRSPLFECLHLRWLIESVLDLNAFENVGVLILVHAKSARADVHGLVIFVHTLSGKKHPDARKGNSFASVRAIFSTD